MQLSKYLIESNLQKKQRRRGLVKESNNSMAGSLNPILKVILEGVYDTSSPFSTLRGTPHIVQMIYTYLVEYWKSLIICNDEEDMSEENILKLNRFKLQPGEIKDFPGNDFVLETTRIAFPPPQDLNIYMMPFVLESSFEKCYLPDYLRPYWENLIRPLFRSRHSDCRNEEGNVCYLNIYEGCSNSIVTRKNHPIVTHSRSGLHTVSQRTPMIITDEEKRKGRREEIKTNGNHILRLSKNLWKKELITRYNKVEAGIYVASSVSNFCAAWNSKIMDDSATDGTNIISTNTSDFSRRTNEDIEHLRNYIGKRKTFKPNTVYWITDRTPFEFLPLSDNTYSQYFSIITHQGSSWPKDYSTSNPLGGVVLNANTKTL